MFIKILFLLSSALTLGSALLVLTTKDIMHACVYLLGTLFGVAGLYVTLGADFVAATQIMVYVGGVVILMLFAVMLTGGKNALNYPRNGESTTPIMGNVRTYVIGGLSSVVILFSVYKILMNISRTADKNEANSFFSTVDKLGTSFLTDHVLAFELSSVLLLGALIGAAMIARPRS